MLYIITVRIDMPPEELERYPLSRSVFKVETDVKSPFFKK